MLREESQVIYRLGIIGSSRTAHRSVPETKVVNGVGVVAVFNPIRKEAEGFATQYGIHAYSDFDTFVNQVVYLFCVMLCMLLL